MFAKILKGTSEGAKKAWITRRGNGGGALDAPAKGKEAPTSQTSTTAHDDSIFRSQREEKAHQKALQSDNWHTRTMAQFKDKSSASLRYIRQDALEAARANPNGKKAGQYEDEVHYASMELKRRQDHNASASKKSDIRTDLGLV